MVIKTFSILKKNLRLILNSKISSIILLLGPLFLMLIIGVALQKSELRDLKLGVYYELEDEEFQLNLEQSLRSEGFIPQREYLLRECRDKVVRAQSHICIEVLEIDNLISSNFENLNSYKINSYLDFSKQSVMWFIIEKMQKVSEKESIRLRKPILLEITQQAYDTKNFLIERKSQIVSLIEDINKIKKELNKVENNTDRINNSIEEINFISNSISSITLEIDNAITDHPELSYTLNPIKNELYLIEIRVNSLKETLRIEKENRNYFNLAINGLDSINEKLILIEKTLSDKIEQFQDLNQERIKEIVNPIEVTHNPAMQTGIYSSKGELKFLDYIFPSILIFIILFTSMILSTTLTIKERSLSTNIRNISSKTSTFSFLFGNFLTCLTIIIIQISIVLLIANFFLNLELFNNIGMIFFYTLLASSLFIIIGASIGYLFNSYESAMIASISLSILFLIFLPVITPIENLPSILKIILNSSPLIILESKLRVTLIFSILVNFSLKEILTIFFYFILSSILLISSYLNSKEKEI